MSMNVGENSHPTKETENIHRKAAVYCRLSEEDKNKQSEEDSNSIQNQKSMLTAYAKEQAWDIYDVYSDDDFTGADRNRPAFRRLLRDAEEHKFDIVLCKTQSRFTRELELVEKYIHGLFPLWGIRFVSIVDNADSANKGNKKARQINGLVNEWYLEDMSDNIKSVLTDRRKNGLHIGAFALYGYRKDPNNKGHLIIDGEAADIVREVFRLYAQGHGKTDIARQLNSRGIPNPTEYKRRRGLRVKAPAGENSTLWSYSAISGMLHNEIYIGNMVQGKYGSVSYKTKKNRPKPKDQWFIVEGTHEPIIDRDLWESVQKLLEQKTKPYQSGKIGVFAKKVRCMGCGYTMRSTKNHDRHYLMCPTRHKAKNACEGAFIAEEKLKEAVLKEFNSLSELYLKKEEVSRMDFSDSLEREQRAISEKIRLCRDKLAENKRIVRELYLDKVKGVISESDFAEMSEDFKVEKNRWEKMLRAYDTVVESVEKRKSDCMNHKETDDCFYTLAYLDRETADKLIRCIYVGRKDEKTGEIPIEIHWNF